MTLMTDEPALEAPNGIKALIEHHKISVTELARITGIPQPQISRAMYRPAHKRLGLSLERERILADALGVAPHELLDPFIVRKKFASSD